MEELINYIKQEGHILKTKLERVWSRGKRWYVGLFVFLLVLLLYQVSFSPRSSDEQQTSWLQDEAAQEEMSHVEKIGERSQEAKLLMGVANSERAYPMVTPFMSEKDFKARLQGLSAPLMDKKLTKNTTVEPREQSIQGIRVGRDEKKPLGSSQRPVIRDDDKPVVNGILQGTEPQVIISYGGQSYCLGQGQSQGDLLVERIDDRRVLIRRNGESLWHELY